MQAVAWNERFKDFSALGYNVAIVTNDAVAVHTQFAEREKISLTLLADRKAEVIEAFGLINEQFPRGTQWYGVAHPMIFVIDAKGVITHRFSTRNYRSRPKVGDVLKLLRASAGG